MDEKLLNTQRRKTSSAYSVEGSRIEKLPTRRPNPSIQNRNALMARENRRRKKEHVKILENQLETRTQETRRLGKMLEEKDRIIKKLEHQTSYLRSILANKTEIMSLLKTIRGNKLPMTSSLVTYVVGDQRRGLDIDESEVFRSPASSHDESWGNNESEASLSPSTCIATSYGEIEQVNDYDLASHHSTISDDISMGDWRCFLNDSNIADPNSKDMSPSSIRSEEGSLASLVRSEHSYNQDKNNDWRKNSSPGICLHISHGCVSLELCEDCHSRSQDAWLEE
ncbi:hypothetical protein Bhyg_01975, partial [Pseudolycoriella hygida]